MKEIYAKDVIKPRVQMTTKSKLDIPLSKIVGHDVVVGTPTYKRAIHLINKWNNSKSDNDFSPVDYLKDENKVKQLKEALL